MDITNSDNTYDNNDNTNIDINDDNIRPGEPARVHRGGLRGSSKMMRLIY